MHKVHYPFVNLQDIFGRNMVDCSNLGLAESTDKQRNEYSLHEGDVLFVRSSVKAKGVGEAAVVTADIKDTTYSGFIIRFRPSTDFSVDFERFVFATNPIRAQIMAKATSSANTNINQESLSMIDVLLPTLPEQTAIGSFFRTLDDAITLYKRKLDGLKRLKSAYLQQMFPQAGENVPKVRFAGFTGEWEEITLGEMLSERNEQIEESEEYPLMSFVGNVGVVPKGEQYDRSFLVKDDNKKYKKTKLNDFIYSSNNLETGSIGFNKTGNAVISPVYSIFYSTTAHESQFVGLLSTRRDFINKMIHYRQGVMYGQWRIHERDFLKIKVMAPVNDEQNKIIEFFDLFDNQITIQSQKLEQAKHLKSAYLSKMFI